MYEALQELSNKLKGELKVDELHKTIYATDASVYKEIPEAIVFPKCKEDIGEIITFAQRHNGFLIPRTAGTSLAGQCVGKGIVVDVSRHMTSILEVDVESKRIWVEPGVIRDELNDYLNTYGLYFGPNTSTSNRCMIGGMVGNNSSGTTSIQYGTTRDHVFEIEGFLSDGSFTRFGELTKEEFQEKCNLDSLEGRIYQQLNTLLTDSNIRELIEKEYPKKSIHRRNQGYAIDALMQTEPFVKESQEKINVAKLICGSEGTLFFMTKMGLWLDPLPMPESALVCAHFDNVIDSLKATQVAMKHDPSLCELMDKIVLDCTKGSNVYEPMRAFVEGDPAAVLMVELRGETMAEAQDRANDVVQSIKDANLGYAYPILKGIEAKNAFKLRTAGLGLLSKIKGDAKPVACIEDTAVALEDLPNYIGDFEKIMASYNQRAVFYAHAGAGELHLRPILNLKEREGVQQFRQITEDVAHLVKSYGGTLSGEHGDGRVRAEFLPIIIGEELYEVCRDIKLLWDPNGIFNRGKIVDAEPMDESLRYDFDEEEYALETAFDFGEEGMMRMIERCNGSGDCRRTHRSGALMCPSYMATLEEKDSTRARANALREFLKKDKSIEAFGGEELAEVMDLCISCKGCTSECPSDVDMASLKAEYLYQKSKTKGLSLRSWMFSHFYDLNRPLSHFPGLGNAVLKLAAPFIKRVLKISDKRDLPQLSQESAKKWLKKVEGSNANPKGKVFLFVDEFTDLHESHMYQAVYGVLIHFGYEIKLLNHKESGRAAISKGDLNYVKKLANYNVRVMSEQMDEDSILIGIEPSAILSIRDEYPRLVDSRLRDRSMKLATKTKLIDEFLYDALIAGDIHTPEYATANQTKLLLHGHCHQKALSDVGFTAEILEKLGGYKVEVIPSSCCGMAGSFGYEKEHYDLSMRMGELVLFPTVRNKKAQTEVAANGVSCRHQIYDGTSVQAKHAIEYIWSKISDNTNA